MKRLGLVLLAALAITGFAHASSSKPEEQAARGAQADAGSSQILPPALTKALAADAEAVGSAASEALRWSEQKVVDPDGQPGAVFGSSVAVYGKTALIGARGASVNGNFAQGAVLVYTESDGVWSKTQTLVASDGVAGQRFGSSVALHDNRAIVGMWTTQPSRNTVYVFTESNGLWSEAAQLRIHEEPTFDQFGYSVAISESAALVGAWTDTVDPDRPRQGAAYVFEETGGVWSLADQLTANDGKADEQFGQAVALSGTTALIGSKYATLNRDRPHQGAAYVFAKSGNHWTQKQKLFAVEGAYSDFFGQSVAMSGTTALIGSASGGVTPGDAGGVGAVHVFTESNGVWVRRQKFVAPEGTMTSFFGSQLAISGSKAVITAQDAAVDGATKRGEAFLYSETDGLWTQTQRLVASDGSDNNYFGFVVALHNETALIGGSNATNAAYFYSPAVTPAVGIAPAAMRFALMPGQTGTSTLNITNAGRGTLDYAIAESASNGTTIPLTPRSVPAPLMPEIGADSTQSVLSASGMRGPLDAAPWRSPWAGADLEFAYGDGTYEESLTMLRGDREGAAIWLNQFSPPLGTGAFTINSLSILWPQNPNGSLLGKEVNLLAYYDPDGDRYPYNAIRLGGDHLVTIDRVDEFVDYPVNFQVPGDGDIYIGFESSYARGGSSPIHYPGAFDVTTGTGRSWLVSSLDRDPDLEHLGNNTYMGALESFWRFGYWLIRGTGVDAANDCVDPAAVPWLNVVSANGSVAGGASQRVTVEVDATGLSLGNYSAMLCIGSNDPVNRLVRVPISLNVNAVGAIFQDGFDDTP